MPSQTPGVGSQDPSTWRSAPAAASRPLLLAVAAAPEAAGGSARLCGGGFQRYPGVGPAGGRTTAAGDCQRQCRNGAVWWRRTKWECRSNVPVETCCYLNMIRIWFANIYIYICEIVLDMYVNNVQRLLLFLGYHISSMHTFCCTAVCQDISWRRCCKWQKHHDKLGRRAHACI